MLTYEEIYENEVRRRALAMELARRTQPYEDECFENGQYMGRPIEAFIDTEKFTSSMPYE